MDEELQKECEKYLEMLGRHKCLPWCSCVYCGSARVIHKLRKHIEDMELNHKAELEEAGL